MEASAPVAIAEAEQPGESSAERAVRLSVDVMVGDMEYAA
jgi:hypothetical protein